MDMYQDIGDIALDDRVPQMSPGRDLDGRTLQRRNRGVGVGASFTTDIGDLGKNDVFNQTELNVVDEEKMLIDKVFQIVDKDNSGDVDAEELEQMFSLFGVDPQYLKAAVGRILQNVERDTSEGISPQEFYNLLSQKFSKDDPESEMLDLFNRMNEKRNGKMSVDELHKVALMLGESMDKSEINEMIKMFKRMYEERPQEPGEADDDEDNNNKSDTKSVTSRMTRQSVDSQGEAKAHLEWEEFKFIMKSEL